MPGATSYEIRRGSSTNTWNTTFATTNSICSYSDTNVAWSQVLWYWVAARATGIPAHLLSVPEKGGAAPSPPTVVSATIGTDDWVRVTWSASIGATAYVVARGRGDKYARNVDRDRLRFNDYV